MPRARRTTAKAVNYSKEQEFSDAEDIFEDGLNDDDDDEPAKSSSRRRSRPRKSNASSYAERESLSFSTADYGLDGGKNNNNNNSEFEIPEKYRHFEKGYDMNLPHIRERFDFMPELELDGSPKVELIVGRRLIGEGEKEDLLSEGDDVDGDNDDNSADDNGENSSPEKRRRGRRGGAGKKNNVPKTEKKKKKDEPAKHHAEYEYLIKYKGKSYLHLEWKVASELESMNKSAKNLYRRFLKKVQLGNDDDIEDPDFDPMYTQPQKIVDEDEHEITVELDDDELVEWEKQQAKEMEDEEDDDEEEEEIDSKSEKSSSSKNNDEDKDDDNGENEDDSEGKFFCRTFSQLCVIFVKCRFLILLFSC